MILDVVIIVMIAVVVAIYELPPLIKNGWWKEVFAFIVLLGLGIFLAIAQALDLDVPNPVDAVEYIFSPVSVWVDNVLS